MRKIDYVLNKAVWHIIRKIYYALNKSRCDIVDKHGYNENKSCKNCGYRMFCHWDGIEGYCDEWRG